MVDLTVVIGVDQKTIEQADITIPTWKAFRPDMWSMPWVVFYDPFQIFEGDVDILLKKYEIPAVVVPWDEQFPNQREKMLTGFVKIPPQVVETQWWMKVDTDAIAMPNPNWLDASWFEPDENGQEAEWIAPSWGYTKAKAGGTVEEWANKLEAWGDQFDTPRLGLRSCISGNKIIYKRMASWVSFYNTEASRQLLNVCGDRLVVPSQDTVAWYFSERRGARVIRANMKRRNWTNVSNTGRLREKVKEVLGE